MQTGHSDTITDGIRVRVASQFLPERSDPDRGLHFFVYRVQLSNEGKAPARLLSRYWLITDANGETEEVQGPGVVGDQPHLEPGENYEYMSGCPLETEWGTMEGHFVFERDGGERFEVAVGRFFLAHGTAPITALD